MASEKNTAEKKSSWFKNVSDTNLLLMITIVVFFVMYISAMICRIIMATFRNFTSLVFYTMDATRTVSASRL